MLEDALAESEALSTALERRLATTPRGKQ
jgi:hypothetical protein